ncbi:hypothetical protein ACJX0J_040204 [Zea mays]
MAPVYIATIFGGISEKKEIGGSSKTLGENQPVVAHLIIEKKIFNTIGASMSALLETNNNAACWIYITLLYINISLRTIIVNHLQLIKNYTTTTFNLLFILVYALSVWQGKYMREIDHETKWTKSTAIIIPTLVARAATFL